MWVPLEMWLRSQTRAQPFSKVVAILCPKLALYLTKLPPLPTAPQVLQRLGWNARVDQGVSVADAQLCAFGEHATLLSFVGREVLSRCQVAPAPAPEPVTPAGSQDLSSLPFIFERAVSVC